jgi:probable phosphoglycerate mutase
MRLIVARHCQTDWNAQNRIQGQADIPLNDAGRAQAATLAANVKGLGISIIACSDLSRAVETARIVSAEIGAPVLPDARLRECSFGTLDGLSFIEFGLRCGPKNVPGWSDPLDADFTSFGGERGRDVFARQKAALDDLKASHDDGTVMLIGHGRSLRTLLVPLGCRDRRYRTQGAYVIIAY